MSMLCIFYFSQEGGESPHFSHPLIFIGSFSFCVPFLIGFLNQHSLSLISPFSCGLHLQNVFQPVLFFQSLINLKPGTRSIFAHFAFAFSRSSPTGPIEKTFGTPRHRADSCCLPQNTLPAGAAIFLKPSEISIHTDKNGIQGRKHRFVRISVSQKLNPSPTSH
jgi:hypothetical protein